MMDRNYLPQSSSHKRIGFIDAMRGLAMLQVVFGHVMSHGLKDYSESTVVCAFFDLFSMPVFFFISGFVAYKDTERWNGHKFFSMVKGKIQTLLIPTVMFFLLYEASFNRNLVEDFMAHGTMYFWFCQVLFEMFLVYYFIQLCCSYTNSRLVMPLLLAMAICFKLQNVILPIDSNWYGVAVGNRFCPYFLYFVLGLIAKKYQKTFLEIMRVDGVKAMLLIAYILLFLLHYHHEFWGGWLVDYVSYKLVLRLVAMFSVFALFYHYADFWDGESRVARTMRFVGRRTLDIYLIHYFFIPDLSVCADFILTNTRASVELAFGLGVAVWIIALSLAASAVIRISPWLGHFLFGAKRV